jgi:hypothetical protein
MSNTGWIKAPRSADQGSCVESRRHHDMIEVRDSKDPSGPVLRFRPDEYTAWLDGARNGEFDHLLDVEYQRSSCRTPTRPGASTAGLRFDLLAGVQASAALLRSVDVHPVAGLRHGALLGTACSPRPEHDQRGQVPRRSVAVDDVRLRTISIETGRFVSIRPERWADCSSLRDDSPGFCWGGGVAAEARD